MNYRQRIAGAALFTGIPLALALLPKEVDISEDGMYCADVDYYNPKTGTKSSYTLPVRIEDGRLFEIKFYNGGQLDETHFEPGIIDEGRVKIITDTGKEYDVKLLYDGPCD